jgi:hypothetical protein
VLESIERFAAGGAGSLARGAALLAGTAIAAAFSVEIALLAAAGCAATGSDRCPSVLADALPSGADVR